MRLGRVLNRPVFLAIGHLLTLFLLGCHILQTDIADIDDALDRCILVEGIILDADLTLVEDVHGFMLDADIVVGQLMSHIDALVSFVEHAQIGHIIIVVEIDLGVVLQHRGSLDGDIHHHLRHCDLRLYVRHGFLKGFESSASVLDLFHISSHFLIFCDHGHNGILHD